MIKKNKKIKFFGIFFVSLLILYLLGGIISSLMIQKDMMYIYSEKVSDYKITFIRDSLIYKVNKILYPFLPQNVVWLEKNVYSPGEKVKLQISTVGAYYAGSGEPLFDKYELCGIPKSIFPCKDYTSQMISNPYSIPIKWNL